MWDFRTMCSSSIDLVCLHNRCTLVACSKYTKGVDLLDQSCNGCPQTEPAAPAGFNPGGSDCIIHKRAGPSLPKAKDRKIHHQEHVQNKGCRPATWQESAVHNRE